MTSLSDLIHQLEYIYKKPRFLMSCVFGIVFIVFGHLAGNAIQFGVFMQEVIHPNCKETEDCFNNAAVIGWAVAILTLCALINVTTRRLAIGLNNVFAVVKVLMVTILAFTGIIYGSVNGNNCRHISWENKSKGESGKFGDIVLAFFYATYPYTGYEQPFYILAEVKKPRRIFAKYVIVTMVFLTVLFPLTNVGFLCMSPYTGNAELDKIDNMALALIGKIARGRGESEESSRQAVSVILALFIFGNILAQTFTASRVKQEIAKEAILPWSLQLASGGNSLLSRLFSHDKRPAIHDINHHLEQVPIAATFLHWVFEVILVLAFGIPLKPSTSYRALTYLKTFSVVGVLGLFTVWGLLFLKLDSRLKGSRGRRWHEKVAWRPWLDPLPTIIACATLGYNTPRRFLVAGLTILSMEGAMGASRATDSLH